MTTASIFTHLIVTPTLLIVVAAVLYLFFRDIRNGMK